MMLKDLKQLGYDTSGCVIVTPVGIGPIVVCKCGSSIDLIMGTPNCTELKLLPLCERCGKTTNYCTCPRLDRSIWSKERQEELVAPWLRNNGVTRHPNIRGSHGTHVVIDEAHDLPTTGWSVETPTGEVLESGS